MFRIATPAFLILCTLLSCGGEPQPQDDRRPVIFISIDSLRADHCTPYGYTPEFASNESTTPFMQRLANEGALFENCSAAAPWTLPSHVSMLSGMHPIEHGVRARRYRMSNDLELVSSRFQNAGYETGGFYSAPFLHGVWGFARGFDSYEPALDYLQGNDAAHAMVRRGSREIQKFHELADGDRETAPHVVEKAVSWLAEGDRYEDPFFLFLHFWDPHYDFHPPTEYAARFHPDYQGPIDGSGFNDAEATYSADDMAHYRALYDAEIRYTDDHLARLFAQLEKWGIGDDVIIAIVSDHGDEFGEHGQRGHHKTLYEEVMRVPMVIRAHGLIPAGTRVGQSVANYDLAPTLLDLAGLGEWPGRSGLSMAPVWADKDNPGHEVVMDLLHPGRRLDVRGYRLGMQKALWDTGARTFATYDLNLDPGELNPTWVQNPKESPTGAAAMSVFQKAHANPGQAAEMQESTEMTDILGELGYTDG